MDEISGVEGFGGVNKGTAEDSKCGIDGLGGVGASLDCRAEHGHTLPAGVVGASMMNAAHADDHG